MSSSAVAVAAPTGMIMEQDAQPGNADQLSDPQAEVLKVTFCGSPSQTTTANTLETQSTSSSTQVTIQPLRMFEGSCRGQLFVLSVSGQITDQFQSVKSFDYVPSTFWQLVLKLL